MRATFHPLLPNGLEGDPVLWVDVPDEGHAIVVDLGDLHGIPARKLQRVERAIVTHTHMDHFIGFDQLLRRVLGRERQLTLTGPAGFLEHVAGRIAGYTWNVIESYPVRLVVEEIDGSVVQAVAYSGASRMRPEALGARPYAGVVHGDRAYTIHAATLDHGIPVLGVVLAETEHLSVDKDRMVRLGLEPGPWLGELKNDVRRAASPEGLVEAVTSGGRSAHVPARRAHVRDPVPHGRPAHRVPDRPALHARQRPPCRRPRSRGGSARVRGRVPARRRAARTRAQPSHGAPSRRDRARGRRGPTRAVPRVAALRGTHGGDPGRGRRRVRWPGRRARRRTPLMQMTLRWAGPGLAVVLLLLPWCLYQARPERRLDLVVVDKTVPFENRLEHQLYAPLVDALLDEAAR